MKPMNRCKRNLAIVGLYLVTMFFGCTTSNTARIAEREQLYSQTATLLQVPFFKQKTRECGPATLAMVLSWSGLNVQPEDLVPQMISPARQGSLTNDMIGAARRRGRIAYPISTLPKLLKELENGHPVIVLQDLGIAGFPIWHYSVVIGYDLKNEIIVLHSGAEPSKAMPLADFLRSWKKANNWGLLVIPPSRLPATAEEKIYLQAVIGLERATQWEIAEQAYTLATKKWPKSYIALLGLGNSRFARENWHGAQEAYRKAVALDPIRNSARHNLEQVQAKLSNMK